MSRVLSLVFCCCSLTLTTHLILITTTTTTATPAKPIQQQRQQSATTPPQQEYKEGEVPAQYIEQPLDHFDSNDSRTFQQRYYVNDLYFSSVDGPVFLYLSGEASLKGPPRRNSHVDLLARRHGALLIALEHRYYGDSIPFEKLTTPHLKYLNTRQALLDIGAFRTFYQSQLNSYKVKSNSNQIRENMWVAFGGSYAGALGAWSRSKFPELFQAAIVSSAVVNVHTMFPEFDQAIATTVGTGCGLAMRHVSDDLDTFLASSDEDNAYVKDLMKASDLEDGDLRYMVADAVAMAVQYGYKDHVCEPLLKSVGRGRVARLEALANYLETFFYPTLEDNGPMEYSVEYLQNEDADEDKSGRQWWYQKCSELGFFQVAAAPFSTRSALIDSNYHQHLCKALFGSDNVWPDDNAVNLYYGGVDLKATQIFFANGGEDPWRFASVVVGSRDNPAKVADCVGCGHCVDMKEPSQNDPEQLIEMRDDMDRYLTAWIE